MRQVRRRQGRPLLESLRR